MSKSNKPTKTLTAADIQAQMQELQAKLEGLRDAERKAIEEQNQKTIEVVNGLVAHLQTAGVTVTDLNDVRSLIAQVQKGTFGKGASLIAGERKGRTILTEEQKAQVVAVYKAARAEGATPEQKQAGQRSAICAAFDISAPTLQNILKAAGLVTPRAEGASS